MRGTFLVISLALIFASGPSFAQITPGTIRVTVLDVKSSNGDVKCELFNSEAGFPMDFSNAIQRVSAPIQNGQAVCNFTKVLPGDEYAVAVFHDENGNGILDTNFLGIPKEGVGASNDASSTFGPPKYDDAKFKYSGGIQPLTIHLHY